MRNFKKVYIEITNVCNLNCEFCPKTGRKAKFLTINEFKYILDKIKPYSNNVFFHVLGEPLMHPNIQEFFNIADENEINVNITTNGTLIKKTADILIAAKKLKKINISLHSFEANEGITSMTDYLTDILDFVDNILKKRDTIISLRMWDVNNEKDKKNKFEMFKILEERYNLDFKLEEVLSYTKGVQLKKSVYLNQAEIFKWPDMKRDKISENGFCYGLRDQFAILVDGKVVPCCLDGQGCIDLGNIFRESLENILNSKRATEIYKGFSSRKVVEELCKKCSYRKRFDKK